MALIDLVEEPLRGRIELVIDAVSEMFYSLHVLAEPAHHLSNQVWAKQTLAVLSPALCEQILYFGNNFNQWLNISDLTCRIGTSCDGIAPFLARLQELSPGEVVEIAINGLGSEMVEYTPALPTDPEVIAAHAQARTRPGDFVDRLTYILEGYWREIFAAEWVQRYPLLEQRRAQEATRLDHMESLDWLTSLNPRITYDHVGKELVFHKMAELRFALARISKIRCQPSTFTPPHLMVSYAYDQVGICLNVPLLPSTPEFVPMKLLLALKALSDKTRLRIFRLVIKQPGYTQELAKSLKLAEPTVSRHLKVLQMAHLVHSYKDGPVVRYAGSLELVDQLPALMREFIQS